MNSKYSSILIASTLAISTMASDDIDHAGSFASGSTFTKATGEDSVAHGWSTIATGDYSFAAGICSRATGEASNAEGWQCYATGDDSHAEGNNTLASGIASHAEGWSTIASNWYDHAEGYDTIALGAASHVEGAWSIASGSISHADGWLTSAEGVASKASGTKAIAAHDAAFVWSSSDEANDMEFESTTNRQFNVYADNGIRLETGTNSTITINGEELEAMILRIVAERLAEAAE
jgi:hypothetical protein